MWYLMLQKRLTSRQSQRRHLSRSVQSHRSRQLPSRLTCNVRLGIMRCHEYRDVSVKVEKGEAFVFEPAIGMRSIALFESSVLQSAHVRAGWSKALPDVRLSCAAILQHLIRLERTHALRPGFLGMRGSHVPNQPPEPTTTAVTICAEPQIAPAAVVGHL